MITVRRLTEELVPAWDDYVRRSPSSTIYHLVGIKRAIEETYQARTYYLLALDEAKNIAGVLPLVCLRFPGLTDALISMPYSSYGGVLAGSDRAALALLREAESIRRDLGLGSLLTKGLSHADFEAFTDERIHESMMLDMTGSFEQIVKTFARSVRKLCRKAERLGARVSIGHDEQLLRDFYGLYIDQQHRKGSPMHSMSWFRQLQRHLGEQLIFAVAYLGGQPVAAQNALVYGKRIIANNGGRKLEHASSGANHLLHLEMIRYARAKGLEIFDFARSQRGTGPYDFKWSLGARPVTTYYQYSISPGRRKPTTDPWDPRFKLPVEIWKRLPRPVVSRIGPRLRKYLAT